MKKRLYLFMFMLTALFYSLSANAVSIQNTKGWFESGYVTWAREAGATYTVYYRPAGGTYVQMDKELVRLYNNYGRADMVGLKAGNYQFKVVSSISGEAESDVFYAAPHDRSGFAHIGMTEGIGAYKNDGTLKDNARVIYVTAKTAKTVKCYVMGDKDVEYTGLQAIIAAYEKGKETRPLCVRIIGTVKAADMDSFGSNEGLQVKGKSGSTNMNITIEGIGSDAAVHGFGFLARSAKSVEFRNFGILLFMDDGISVDTDNHNVWIHNMDIFYGGTGGDADQAKGDGSVDIKGKSSNITMSYCHFWDSGKCSLGGMKGETTDCWMTFHHNWFDHSDSRHPRIRTAFYHVYNNYFDGNSKYGVGVTSGGSSFVESNYFRNCKYPVLISKQGTDAEGDGTFSGEDGGVNKIFNNIFINPRKVQIYDGEQTDGKWDAVEVDNRSDEVSVKCLTGGTGYNNAADAAARTTYVENNMDDPEDIPAIVRGEFITREGLGAGRIDGGDFKWTFDNSQQDENYDVISDLKTAVVSYESTVQSFGDGTAISDRTPATATVDAGDGKGIDQETNDSYIPSWAGGSGTAVATGKQVVGVGGDYFWFVADNATQLNTYMTDGGTTNPSTISTNGTFDKNRTIINSKIGSCSDIVGSIQLPSKGHLTLYNVNGITSAAFYVSASGSQSWQLSYSTDGISFANYGDVISGKTGAHPKAVYTGDGTAKYVRITNTNSGARDVQGVMLYIPGEAALTKVNTTDIAINQRASYTLTSGIDYTSTSTGALTYASSSTKVATVDAEGEITGVSAGTATITMSQAADADHDAAAIKFTVKVTDGRATSTIAATPTEITMAMGDTDKKITPAGYHGAVTYTSGAPSVVTVDTEGNITAVGYGTASITVSDAGDDSYKPGLCTVRVTVNDDRATSSIDVESLEMQVNRNASVKINVIAHDGTVTFRSSDETIATVDNEGNVTGVMAGEAVIAVSDPGDASHKPGVKNVTVNVNDTRAASDIQVISDNPLTIDMNVAKSSQIKLSGDKGTVIYESEDINIASVSETGLITAKRAGTIKITISCVGDDDYLPSTTSMTVTVIAVETDEPVTWILGKAQYTKSGSFSSSGENIFVSTDETASELRFVANGGGLESQKGYEYLNTKNKTNYNKDKTVLNRYFVTPALSGSGTLSVTYAVLDKGRSNIQVRNGNSSESKLLGTITFSDNSIQLENLSNTTLYMTFDSDKVYVVGITWTPDAPAVMLGDVNNDGSVTMADANMVVNYFLAEDKDSISGFNKEAGDVNKDGDISMADANAIVNIFLSGNTQ